MSDASQWVWMPHPAHFICAFDCRFHLATMVGSHIVSTVGELWPCDGTRKIIAETRGITINGIGDEAKYDYMEKIGFDTIGCDRKYETMVFKAESVPDRGCCPWKVANYTELEINGYNSPKEAFEGHMDLCAKWSLCDE